MQLLPLPSTVDIEPVGPGWPAARGLAPALMSFQTFCRLIDDTPALAEIELGGALDPLLHPRFVDMVRHAVARGVRVGAHSALTGLSDRRAEDCVQSGLHRMRVALAPPRPRAPGEIRVDVGFDRTLRNVRRLSDARRRLGSATPEIELLETLTRPSLAQLPRLVALAQRHGVDCLSVVDIEEVTGEVLSEAQALAKDLGMRLRLLDSRSDEPGQAWNARASIGIDGRPKRASDAAPMT